LNPVFPYLAPERTVLGASMRVAAGREGGPSRVATGTPCGNLLDLGEPIFLGGSTYRRGLQASKGELKTPEFLAINPLGRVPALRDGDYTLHESLAIMVYLDRKHPSPPLFGRTAKEDGRIYQHISESISDFWPSSQRVIRSILFGPPLGADEARAEREKVHWDSPD
jgi:hypothetical protein